MNGSYTGSAFNIQNSDIDNVSVIFNSCLPSISTNSLISADIVRRQIGHSSGFPFPLILYHFKYISLRSICHTVPQWNWCHYPGTVCSSWTHWSHMFHLSLCTFDCSEIGWGRNMGSVCLSFIRTRGVFSFQYKKIVILWYICKLFPLQGRGAYTRSKWLPLVQEIYKEEIQTAQTLLQWNSCFPGRMNRTGADTAFRPLNYTSPNKLQPQSMFSNFRQTLEMQCPWCR